MKGYPYTDLTDFSQRIASDSNITDKALQSVCDGQREKTCGDAVIASAVDYYENGVSVTTGYNGITILLFNQNERTKRFVPRLTMVGSAVTLSSDRIVQSWSAFMRDFNISQPSSTASSTEVSLAHSGHELYLNVYDSQGRHVGNQPKLAESKQGAIGNGDSRCYVLRLSQWNGYDLFQEVPKTSRSQLTVLTCRNERGLYHHVRRSHQWSTSLLRRS